MKRFTAACFPAWDPWDPWDVTCMGYIWPYCLKTLIGQESEAHKRVKFPQGGKSEI